MMHLKPNGALWLRLTDLPGRLLGLAMAPVLLLAIVLGSYVIHERRVELENRLGERSQLLARQLASAADYGIFSGNQAALDALVGAVAREVDVLLVAVLDAQGRPMARQIGDGARASDPVRIETWLPRLLAGENTAPMIKVPQGFLAVYPVRSTVLQVDDVLENSHARRPVEAALKGHVVVALSSDSIGEDLVRFVGIVALVLCAVLVSGVVMARRLSLGIHGPVREALMAAQRIGRGEDGIRLPASCGVATLDRLAASLNQMAEQLELSRQELEGRVELATEALRQQRDAAEKADQAKSRFLAAASHDLRQPMHALSLLVAAVRVESRLEEREVLLERIDGAAHALSGLLDALLDISRLDAGRVQPRFQEIDLAALLRGVLETHRAAAERKHIELVWRIGPCWGRTDPVWLERIVGNYLGNAIRYTPEGGCVMVAVRRRGGNCQIEVRDNGPGIAADQQELIFQEFFQLHNPQRDRSEGLGLGLAIVERLAGPLGHPIGVRSVDGKGAVFWVGVPYAAVRQSAAGQVAVQNEVERSTPAPQSDCPLSGWRLLIVEDDELVLESYRGLLRLWGADVLACCSAGEALGVVDAGMAIDAVITDYRLGADEDGLMLIEQLRRQVGVPVPAIVATGDTENATLRSMSVPGVRVMYKPLRPGLLLKQLKLLARAGGDIPFGTNATIEN